MNIGILTEPYDDVSYTSLLYLLDNGEPEILDTMIKETSIFVPNRFKIREGGHCFHFSYKPEDLDYCDVKIYIRSTSALSYPTQIKEIVDQYKNSVDKILFAQTSGEALTKSLLPAVTEAIEDPQVMFICSVFIPSLINHPRAIIDVNLNLFYFVDDFGYYYLNYYPYKDKNHLIGLYNRYDEYKSARTRMKEFFEEKTGCEIYKFKTSSRFFSEVSGAILGKWKWQQMHITSYTDYMTCVANLVFESRMGHAEDWSFTEKTIKSIVFQAADIFFIYSGTSVGMEHLHQRGFWFLNSEFYEPDNLVNDFNFPSEFCDDPKSMPIYRSVFKAIEYVQQLKNELGSNNAVYELLLEKYGDKLRANEAAFNHLMQNCEYRDKLLSFLTDK